MSYSENGLTAHRFSALTLSTAAVIGRIYGPAGAKGKVVGVSTIVTTAITAAATTVKIGTASDDDAFGTLTAPISSVNAGANVVVDGVDSDVAADTMILVTAGGESTAGAADVVVYIQWS